MMVRCSDLCTALAFSKCLSTHLRRGRVSFLGYSETLDMESAATLCVLLHRHTKALSVALGYRDLLTQHHSERVRGLCEIIGLRYGLAGQDLDILRLSASFHDVGKIGIPDNILLKPASLEADEWEIMKRHSGIGEQIMLSTELDGAPQVALVIRHHHEHYNGLGYPDGLSRDEIPVCSRIISIADSYDAMAVTRPYHRPKRHEEIMKILNAETGLKHDPELMRMFCEIIEYSEFKAAET